MKTRTETIAKERPVLLTKDMARAWDIGMKTQTRRMKGLEKVNLDPHNWVYRGTSFDGDHIFGTEWSKDKPFDGDAVTLPCPFGQPGDRLWPREPWRTYAHFDHLKPSELIEGTPIQYLACGTNGAYFDGAFHPGKYRPSMFMCRWMSRNLSKIVSVRAERVQDISERDAGREGVEMFRDIPDADDTLSSKQLYYCLWGSINGEGSWEFNPWVWVIVFKRVG